MSQQGRSKRGRRRPEPGHAPPDSPTKRGWPSTTLTLGAAAVVILVSLWQAGRAWQELPVSQIQQLDARLLRQQFDRGRSQMSGEVRSAWVLNILSAHVATALREPSSWQRLWEDAVGGAAQVRGSHLPRLQLAALKLIPLEQAGEPAGLWWSQAKPLLDGVDPVAFGHSLPPLTAYYARIYRELGARPGTALRLTESAVGLGHGLFLQVIAHDLTRMSEALRDVQPNAADQCDRFRRRLLKEWVLLPGPAELRLLAAELLAEDRAASGRAGEAGALELAAELRSWRSAYRTSACALVPSPFVLGWPERPVPDPWARAKLPLALMQMVSLAALLVAATCVLLITAWSILLSGLAWNRGLLWRALVCAALLTVLVMSPVYVTPTAAHDDLRRLISADLGWPRLPGLVAVCALLVPVAIGCAAPRPFGGRRWAAVALLAWAVVIVGGLSLAGTSIRVRAGLARYETELARAGIDGFAAVAGPQADTLLSRLRSWNPP